MTFYTPEQREVQQRFQTQALADTLEKVLVHAAITPDDQAFVESRDMFFLSTVDAGGQPTVSYKGGAPGFVRVLGEHELVFPSYDGNGMFYSVGNMVARAPIGMLFIDFEHPHRLRLQGEAQVSFDDPLLADFPGAELLVRVRPHAIFVNCPRYVHRRSLVQPSKYVPDGDGKAPMPAWKKIDLLQGALAPADLGKAQAAGDVITVEEYGARHAKGED